MKNFFNKNILKCLEVLLMSSVIFSMWIIKHGAHSYSDANIILATIVGIIGYSYNTYLLKKLYKLHNKIQELEDLNNVNTK